MLVVALTRRFVRKPATTLWHKCGFLIQHQTRQKVCRARTGSAAGRQGHLGELGSLAVYL